MNDSLISQTHINYLIIVVGPDGQTIVSPCYMPHHQCARAIAVSHLTSSSDTSTGFSHRSVVWRRVLLCFVECCGCLFCSVQSGDVIICGYFVPVFKWIRIWIFLFRVVRVFFLLVGLRKSSSARLISGKIWLIVCLVLYSRDMYLLSVCIVFRFFLIWYSCVSFLFV